MFSQVWTIGAVALEVLSVILSAILSKKNDEDSKSKAKRKSRIDFLENSSRIEKGILWDDVKTRSNQDAIHNLDEITTESCRLGIEQTLRSKIKLKP